MRRVSVCGKGAWIRGGGIGQREPERLLGPRTVHEGRSLRGGPLGADGPAPASGLGLSPGRRAGLAMRMRGPLGTGAPPGAMAQGTTVHGSRLPGPRLSRTPHLPASRHCGGGAGRGRRSWRATAVGHVRPPLVSVSEALSGRARPLLPCGPWLLSCVQGGLCCRGGDRVALRPGQLLPGPSRRTPPGRADAQIHLGWRSVCRADDDAL